MPPTTLGSPDSPRNLYYPYLVFRAPIEAPYLTAFRINPPIPSLRHTSVVPTNPSSTQPVASHRASPRKHMSRD